MASLRDDASLYHRWIGRSGLAGETALAGALALLLLALAWQAPGPITVEIGPPAEIYLAHFEPTEIDPRDGRDYRWAGADGELHFPGLGVRTWQVMLTAAAGPRKAGRPPLTIRAAGDPVLAVPAADLDFHTYTFTVPARDLRAGDLVLDLDIPPFRAPGEKRDLALAVDRVVLDSALPRAPAPLAWLALAASLALLYATARLALSWRAAAALTAAGGLGLAGLVAGARLLVTPYASYLPMIAGLSFAGLYTLRAALHRGWVAGDETRRVRFVGGRVTSGDEESGVRNQESGVGLMGALLPALLMGYALFSFGGQVTLLARKPLPDDFIAFYRAAGRLLAHQPLYDAAQLMHNPLDAGYKYPPLFALALAPVAGLPPRTALGAWNGANLAFLAAALLAILGAHGRRPGDAAPASLALLTLALLFQPAIDTLIAGQMDLAILGLVALTYAALRAGRPGLAGLPLAVAILLKLYPAVLLGYLLLRREWRALASCAAWGAALVAIFLPWTGARPWWDFLTIALPHNGGPTAWIENQTFAGFLARLLTDRIDLQPFSAGGGLTGPWRVGIVLLGTVAWALAVLGMATWAAWRPAARRSPAYALGFAGFTTACILVLPNAWYHYMTLLILPLGVAFYTLEEAGGRWRADHRALVVVLAGLGVAAVLLTFGTYQVVWNGINLGGPWKLGLSYKFYGSVALFAALLWMLRRAPGSPPQARG